MSKYTEDDLKIELETKEYEYGFYTDLKSETFPIGLNEDIVRAISLKKDEPEWMTNWRIEAFRAWQEIIQNPIFKLFLIILLQKQSILIKH